eukprot:TRINITY_DN1311_c0_g1_i6.p1 TRINITY_DN1311_c0_g1~~TRINITY_DN1311_c0_g1_i6.p1  ORF type:complete len:1724 (+),score=589.32 TRINITY_DN1311_c0_g1_i6:117-5288(+)
MSARLKKRSSSISGASEHSGVSFHSSASGISSGSSSSSGSVLLLGGSNIVVELKNRLFILFSFIAKAGFPPAVATIFCVIDLFQLFSFAFSGPFVGLWGSADDAVLGYIDVVRTFGAGRVAYSTTVAVFWIVVAWLIILLLLAVGVGVRLASGEESWTRVSGTLRYMLATFAPVLYMPSLSYLIVGLSCSNDKMARFPTEDIACPDMSLVVVGPTFAAVAIVTGAMCSALFYPIFPEKGQWFSVASSRGHMLLFATKTVLALCAEFLVFVPSSSTVNVVYGVVGFAGALAVLGFVVFMLPYHRAVTNYAVAAALSVCCVAFVLRLIAFLAGPSVTFAYVFAALAAAVGGIVAAITFARSRVLCRWSLGSISNGEKPHFEKEFQVEIATRFAYGSEDPEVVETAMTIYIRACEQFPQSAAVRLAQVTFMMCHMTDYQLVKNYISRAKRTQMQPDQLYGLHCVDSRRKERVQLTDGGEEEITDKLARASRLQEHCKKWISAFWQNLAREDELSKLLEIVSSIDQYERKADDVFRALLVKFPRSARVMRAFGVFLAEVKADLELSRLALRNADDLEEERTRHSHKRRILKDTKKRRAGKSDSIAKSGSEAELKQFDDVDKGTTAALRSEQPMQESGKANLRFEPMEMSDDDEEHETSAAVGDAWATEGETSMDEGKASIVDAYAEQRRRREDMQRNKRYRKRLEQMKSTPLQRLGTSVKVTILVLLVDIVVIFASTKAIVTQFSQSVEVLDNAGMVRNWAAQQVINARGMHMAASVLNDTNRFEIMREQLRLSCEYYRQDLKDMRYGLVSQDIDNLWDEAPHAEVQYQPVAGIKKTFTANMHTLSLETITAGWAVSQLNFANMSSVAKNKDYRYIIDNANVLSLAYEDSLNVYVTAAVSAADTMSRTLYVLLSVSVVALALLALVVFQPTVRRIREEREAGVRLFTAVPKLAVSELLQSLQGDQKDELAAANETELDLLDDGNALLEADVSSEGEMPILRMLAFRYFGSLAVIFAVIVPMFALGLAFPSLTVPATYEVMWSYNRFANSARCQLFSNELALLSPPESDMINDLLTFSNRSQVEAWLRSAVDEFKLETYGLKYGNESMGLPGDLAANKANYELVFNQKCHLPELGDNCFGLDAMSAVFVRELGNILSSPSTVSVRTPAVEKIKYMLGSYMYELLEGAVYQGDGEMTIMLRKSATLYKQRTLDVIESVDVPLLALFIVAFPVLLVSFLVLSPLENKIRQENIRTMKMLLMVPGDVINNVPALAEYLDTGKQENAQQKLKAALDEYVARNESILSSSVDGIVVVSAAKQIEMFSPAAQAIFGFTEDDVKGKSVNVMLPPGVATQHDSYMDEAIRNGRLSSRTYNRHREMVARRKDGSEFPILLSLNLLKINEKVLLSAFIRDISNQKEKDAALRREKEKSEKLLQALLPEVIADQLREEGVNPSSEQLLHAEGYKEVSVLFADLVGFTKMSAGISPSELVFTLNKLFSMFDMLCDKHNLEKIKTIGDCYMVAGGCPERSVDHPQRMLEFAIEMLERLREFNQEFDRQLKLRIGINVGPVVAGVLGLKKITYDLWGDAVNVASRMESSGVENRIQVSHAAFEALKHDYIFEERGKMEIKGKGLMLTYLYKDRKLSKTASGTVVRRAALTPPPGAAGSRRNSMAPDPNSVAPEPNDEEPATAEVVDESQKGHTPRTSDSAEIREWLSGSAEIRQKPTVSFSS